jgi:F0F1-type ATP synthase membrane subunit b/b'
VLNGELIDMETIWLTILMGALIVLLVVFIVKEVKAFLDEWNNPPSP